MARWSRIFKKAAAQRKRRKVQLECEHLESRWVLSPGINPGGTIPFNGMGEGRVAQNTTLFDFRDTGTTPHASDFTAFIDWGDGTTDTATAGSTSSTTAPAVIVNDAVDPTLFHLEATAASHGYAEAISGGTFKVTVTDIGSGNTTGTVSGPLNITEGSFNFTNGTPFTTTEGLSLGVQQLATFTHANGLEAPDEFSAIIDWGDGTTSSANALTQNADGSYSVRGSGHIYGEDGTYTIRVNVLEDAGSSSSGFVTTDKVTVVEGPFTVTPLTAASTAEGTSTGALSVASFTHGGDLEPASDFTAVIDWGDGQTSAGAVSQPGGSGNPYLVQGSHAYSEDGSFTVTVNVLEDGGASSSGFQPAGTATVTEPAINVGSLSNLNGSEGTPLTSVGVANFTHANGIEPASDFTAVIDWDDGTTSAGSVSQPGGSGNPYLVRGSHTYAEDGSFAVKVNVLEDSGAVSSGFVTATTASISEGSFTGVPVSVADVRAGRSTGTIPVASFSHANGLEPASDFTAVIDWGDGTTSAGSVSQADGSGTAYVVQGSHTYSTKGSYPIQVQLTEDKGGITLTTRISVTAATPLLAVGADVGALPQVNVYDATTGGLTASFFAFPTSFTGGVRVAVGDVNGDGFPDVLTASGPGMPTEVKVFDGRTGAGLYDFDPFPSSPAYTGGIYIAAGDVNGDGYDDIVVGAGSLPEVKVFGGGILGGQQLYWFNAFDASFLGGVTVAAGDVNGDGFADLVTGTASGASRVRVFGGGTLGGVMLQDFYAYDPAFVGGVFVAAGDVTGGPNAELVIGAGVAPQVKVLGPGQQLLNSFFAFDPQFTGGVRVGTVDVNGDSVAELAVGAGPAGGSHVRILEALPLAEVDSLFAFGPTFNGGVFIT